MTPPPPSDPLAGSQPVILTEKVDSREEAGLPDRRVHDSIGRDDPVEKFGEPRDSSRTCQRLLVFDQARLSTEKLRPRELERPERHG
jgi:hypothetical protein